MIVTPEYNHSFPASLKNTIDWFDSEWHAKPVGFVSYGGMAGGQRAVEHLRQVFAELHAVTVRDTLSFHMAWERFFGATAVPVTRRAATPPPRECSVSSNGGGRRCAKPARSSPTRPLPERVAHPAASSRGGVAVAGAWSGARVS